MKSYKFAWLGLFIQSSLAIFPIPPYPEVPDFELICRDTDICCQQRYPTFVKRYAHPRRLRSPIVSINVDTRNPKNGLAYADYQCVHTAYGVSQTLPKPREPSNVEDRISPQTFTLTCQPGEIMKPDKRLSLWKKIWSREAGICLTPEEAEEHEKTVASGSTVCKNKVAPISKKRQVAEIHQEPFVIDEELDRLLEFMLTDVANPSVQEQGVEAISMEAQPGRIYRACATGSGQFSWEIGSSSSSSSTSDKSLKR